MSAIRGPSMLAEGGLFLLPPGAPPRALSLVEIQQEKRAPLLALNGARFVAVMHILLLHLAVASRDGSIAFWFFVRDAPPWLLRFLRVPVSTNFFVLLSGFVLTYVYAGRAGQLRTTSARFIGLRITRILPVYILSLLIAAPVYFVMKEHTTAEAIQSTVLALTLTQAWLPNHELWWNGPAWYFSVMLLTYFSFAPLLHWMQPLKNTALLFLLGACVLLAIAPALCYRLLLPELPGPNNAGWTWLEFVKFNPVLWIPNFAAGMIAARLFLAGQEDELTPAATNGIWKWLGEVALSAVILIMLTAPEGDYLLLRQGLLAPLLLLVLVSLAHGRGPLARLLSSNVLRGFGESSFGIFALHMPLIVAALRFARGPTGPDGTLYGHWTELILFVAGIPIAARICYRYFELPLIHQLRLRFLAPTEAGNPRD